ncbi:relaxase/mobilization nuclease domain-containing protein [Anaerostipes sp.]|uniref:relaxase/mobilization nuclease domain-containing protein n=1 Tax=Anaerostipes sp. TaxID=1872530 RepID=UPI0039941CBE
MSAIIPTHTAYGRRLTQGTPLFTPKKEKKTGGYIAWHGYQIIVVTHLDRGHLHNHFCFNSATTSRMGFWE